jgi:AcrR family transcriptional regulator
MDRKKIQEQRMKEYFIQATKEILKGEGMKALSVRSIAEKAGYSFATLYNYFKDVKDLVFFCVKDFQKECEEHVKLKSGKTERGKKRIAAIVEAYMDYFVQYPGVFDLFFMERLAPVADSKTGEAITRFLDELCEEEINYCIAKSILTKKEATQMLPGLRSASTGLLLLYLNRHSPPSYDDFLIQTKQQLDTITKGKK